MYLNCIYILKKLYDLQVSIESRNTQNHVLPCKVMIFIILYLFKQRENKL